RPAARRRSGDPHHRAYRERGRQVLATGLRGNRESHMASQTGARERTSRSKQAPRLVALGAAGPREGALTARHTTVGSAAENDLVIEHNNVSRHHARLTRTLAGIRVVDLESTNGTLVNGRRIRRPVTLRRGDEVQFGLARFAFMPGARIAPAALLGVRVGFGT